MARTQGRSWFQLKANPQGRWQVLVPQDFYRLTSGRKTLHGLKPDLLTRNVAIVASFDVFHYKEADAQAKY